MNQTIEVHGFKWPKRPTAVASAWLFGEDSFGRWLGIRPGDPWHQADGSQHGVFTHPFVKLVPTNTFWTACFNPSDPVIDVDIVLPVYWFENRLEEVDLELDILRTADGHVIVRDQDAFAIVRSQWGMPDSIAVQAEATCTQIRKQVEDRCEPFGMVWQQWLARWLATLETV